MDMLIKTVENTKNAALERAWAPRVAKRTLLDLQQQQRTTEFFMHLLVLKPCLNNNSSQNFQRSAAMSYEMVDQARPKRHPIIIN